MNLSSGAGFSLRGASAPLADVHVWRVRLDGPGDRFPAPTTGEAARAARFVTGDLSRRYLRSHGALRAILGRYTKAPLDFGLGPHGKPYLPAAPELQFNLSHSHERALVAIAWGVEIGVDVERFRSMSDCLALAERFFPPVDAAAFAEIPEAGRQREFFRHWTRIESRLKARGLGLYGIGEDLTGEWTLEELDAGAEYAAAVAVARAGMLVTVHDFEGGA